MSLISVDKKDLLVWVTFSYKSEQKFKSYNSLVYLKFQILPQCFFPTSNFLFDQWFNLQIATLLLQIPLFSADFSFCFICNFPYDFCPLCLFMCSKKFWNSHLSEIPWFLQRPFSVLWYWTFLGKSAGN